MKHKITALLLGLKPLDISELIILLLTAVTIPFDWFVATRCLMLLILNTLIKLCHISLTNHRKSSDSKHVENSTPVRHTPIPMTRWAKLALWGLLAYYGLYLISLLYTSNMETAQNYLIRKLPFVGFALFALLSDTSYFNQKHLRLVLYSFTASLLVKFLIRFFIMLFTAKKIQFGSSFDPVHHTYMAMYIMMALAFLYGELFHYGKQMSKGIIAILSISMILLVADLVLVLSRTGIAGIIVMAAAAVIHQIIVTKNIKTGIIAIAIAVACSAGIYLLLPESSHRLTQTASEIAHGDKSDVRFDIMGAAVDVIKENMPWGVGVGDRTDALMEHYNEIGNESLIKASYNPHNIYLDSILTIGIPGLLLLLTLFGLFYVVAFRQKDIAMLGWVFTVSFSGLFEALFDRQMGIMYFAFFFVLFCICHTDAPAQQTASEI